MKKIDHANGPRAFTSDGHFARDADFSEIPIIDFGPMLEDDPASHIKVAAELRDACVNVGFFYLKNHGVPQEIIDRVFSEGERFFAKPEEEKLKVHINKSDFHRGFGPMFTEQADSKGVPDVHEAFDLSADIPADDPEVLAGNTYHGPNQWPEDMPDFCESLIDYQEAVLTLGRRLFRAFALALDLGEDYFEQYLKRPGYFMRVIHYPPQETREDDPQLGIGAHSDYECFTILAQGGEMSALQVLNSRDEWISAPPIPGTFVVNIGDMMTRWTNDYFLSTVHRVFNGSGQERYSIPFFYGVDYDAMIEPLESCVSEELPAKYPPVNAYQYVHDRLSAAYTYIGDKEAATG